MEVLKYACAASACTVAEILSFPLELTKIRLQVDRTAITSHFRNGMFKTAQSIFRIEGLKALYRGVAPAVLRQHCNMGLQFALYQRVNEMMTGGKAKAPIYLKFLASAAVSGSCVLFSSPMDVVKINMASDAKIVQRLFPFQTVVVRQYQNSMDCALELHRLDGKLVFWRGLAPNLTRTAVINATNIVSYDITKQFYRKHFGDNTFTYAASGLTSAFTCSVIAVPLDVVKTRFVTGASGGLGVLGMLKSTFKNEGLRAMWKGWFPTFCRYSPYQFVFYQIYEGMSHLLIGKGFEGN